MRLVSQVSWLNQPRAEFQLLEQKESSLLLGNQVADIGRQA